MMTKSGTTTSVREGDDVALFNTEETPLLEAQCERPHKPTPLPIGQITLLLLAQVTEPLVSQSILPYINDLVSKLDIIKGDRKKIGYYAGLIESLFFAAEALTIFQWGSLSDRIGRKPVILIGLTGMAASTILFGLSTTFWSLVASRCLCGALNGNVGVMKSSLGELTDETNRAQGFAFIPVSWAIGASLGPFIGGVLSHPQKQFPSIFTRPFWTAYPYFLPCAVAAGFTLLAVVLIALYYEETLGRGNSKGPITSSNTNEDVLKPRRSVPVRELLTSPVKLAVSNYAMLALLDIAVVCMAPLYYSTPIPLGGLGLSPAAIGVYMGIFSFLNGASQLLIFPRIVRRIGIKMTLYFSMGSFIPIFLWFPIMNKIARLNGMSMPVWTSMAAHLALLGLMDMSYPIIFVYITASAPNKHSYGAVNGLAQTVTSIMRAVGPAAATSLFAASLEGNIAGGNFVYIMLVALSSLSLLLVARLPTEPWTIGNDD